MCQCDWQPIAELRGVCQHISPGVSDCQHEHMNTHLSHCTCLKILFCLGTHRVFQAQKSFVRARYSRLSQWGVLAEPSAPFPACPTLPDQ